MSIYQDFDGEFINEKKKYMPSFYTKYSEKLNTLMNIVKWAKDYKEAMYCFLNDLQDCPKCEYCGSDSVFRGAPKYGYYNRFCCLTDECRKAAAAQSGSKEAQEKARQTSLRKYGVENHMKNEDVIRKRNETCLKRYGGHPWSNNEVRAKIYKTCEERFGGSNPMNSEDVKAKRVETWQNKYGYDNPMCSKEVKEKRESTWLDKYGETHHFKIDSIKEKYKKSCLENFGYDNPFKSPEIWDSIRDTLEERYGVRHNMQSPETCEQANTSNFRSYTSYRGNEYRLQGYEHFAIELLEDMEIPFVNDRRDVNTLSYTIDNKDKRYFPDIKLANGSYIEVKSDYTFHNSLEKMYHVIKCNPEIELSIWIFDCNGELINTYNKQEILDRYLKCQS